MKVGDNQLEKIGSIDDNLIRTSNFKMETITLNWQQYREEFASERELVVKGKLK